MSVGSAREFLEKEIEDQETKKNEIMAEEKRLVDEQRSLEKKSKEQAKQLFENLRTQMSKVESNILLGEQEILKNDQMAFTMKQGQWAISNTIHMHVI
jgi:type II secretory pathway predicted ATPase ExeA